MAAKFEHKMKIVSFCQDRWIGVGKREVSVETPRLGWFVTRLCIIIATRSCLVGPSDLSRSLQPCQVRRTVCAKSEIRAY